MAAPKTDIAVAPRLPVLASPKSTGTVPVDSGKGRPVSELLAAADRNMWAAWTAVVAAGPVPGRVEESGLLLLSSGVPAPLFNPAYVTGPGADPARAMDHYGSLAMPFVLYFREEAAEPGLAEACADAGLVEHYQPPLMVLDPVPPAPEPPPGLVIEKLTADNVDSYSAVLAEGFSAPKDLMDMLFGASLIDVDGLTGYLGSIDGTPAATSASFLSNGIVGVYNVATVPEHRGKGAGAALTWAAATAGLDAGLTTSILQSSAEGLPVYSRMGFSTGARYRQFEWWPSQSAQNA